MALSSKFSVAECVVRWVLYLLAADFCFYVAHRTLHTPWLYHGHHDGHHEFKVTPTAKFTMNSLVANCLTPFDMFFEGMLPVMLPSLLISLPFTWLYSYFLFHGFWFAVIHSTGKHCGLVPSLGGIMVTPTAHAIHHNNGIKNCNFAAHLTLWDRLLGTYEA